MLNSFQHLITGFLWKNLVNQILRSFQDLRMTVGRSPIKRVTYMVILSEAKNLFEDNHFVGARPQPTVFYSPENPPE